MSKIICDSHDIVRFYFQETDNLIADGELLITPYGNIGWPSSAERKVYDNVRLPADLATSQYFYDGSSWMKNTDWIPD